jgi:tol-pal system protein YbgF
VIVRPVLLSLLAGVALGGCALRSDVRRLEEQLADVREETQQRDSVRAAELSRVIALQQATLDSLQATRQAVTSLRGEMTGQLYEVQKQLVQVQELTGQSTRRLSELRADLDARGQEIGAAEGAAVAPAAGNPSATQMYEASLQQLRGGSNATARAGFRQLLTQYPDAPQAADALYFIGESFATESPDSASAYYAQVVQRYASSPRAAGALYKIGLLAESRKDAQAARTSYQRLVQLYPNSNEAALARDRMKALGQ